MCCLDILNDMLKRFGSLMLGELDKIQKAVLPQLTSGRPATRKRAISCLGIPSPLVHFFRSHTTSIPSYSTFPYRSHRGVGT